MIEIIQSGVSPYDKYMNLTYPCNFIWAKSHTFSFTKLDKRNIGTLEECGVLPSLSAFNKLQALMDRVRSNQKGLVLYLDADALVTSSENVVQSMLRQSGSGALIWASNGRVQSHKHDINNGVFLWNLSHPLSTPSIKRWYRLSKLHKCNVGKGIRDQALMHIMLQELIRSGHESAIRKVTGFDNGPFVMHFMRNKYGSHSNWMDNNHIRRKEAIESRISGLPWCRTRS